MPRRNSFGSFIKLMKLHSRVMGLTAAQTLGPSSSAALFIFLSLLLSLSLPLPLAFLPLPLARLGSAARGLGAGVTGTRGPASRPALPSLRVLFSPSLARSPTPKTSHICGAAAVGARSIQPPIALYGNSDRVCWPRALGSFPSRLVLPIAGWRAPAWIRLGSASARLGSAALRPDSEVRKCDSEPG